jgi:hypothetical protein
MSWEDALDLVVAVTGHARYRALCADTHPDRDIWRRRMLEQAQGWPSDPITRPAPVTLPPGPAPAAGPCGGCPGSPLALDDPELEIDHPQGL